MSQTIPPRVVLGLAAAVFACSAYANLSFLVKDPADYRFFPPFKAHVNANSNTHLGAEYFNIARSSLAGDGFAHPFDRPTGPTAWQGPVLPVILAGLLWVCDGSRAGVTGAVVLLQDLALIGTGLLVVALARQTTKLAPWFVAALFVLGLLGHFHLCFQHTEDYWLGLVLIDLLIAGLCRRWPGPGMRAVVLWGVFGGLCALTTPILGFTWGLCSLLASCRRRTWFRFAAATLVAGFTLAPWTVRNYLVFGRFIPVKSNAAYELYQSQCLQREGLLQVATFRFHPYTAAHQERKEYDALGEVAFLDRKQEQFQRAVAANPQDFVRRVADRLVGATLWYEPFQWVPQGSRAWSIWLSRCLHPLPFLALLILLCTNRGAGLHKAQWVVIAVYLLYLLPYVGLSYYERYTMPLLAANLLLVIWGVDRLWSSGTPE
jgi:hypothetical protein